jgi:hypothetical protein
VVLPTFIVIGANKGGTTSLWHYLDQHPEVFMSRNKEPRYFANIPAAANGGAVDGYQSKVVRSWPDYVQLFEQGRSSRAIGEASTTYLRNTLVPARIHAQLPDVRLVAMLRNPFDRAFSHFRMYQRLGWETRSFPEAIEAELDHIDGPTTGRDKRRYLHPGFYGGGLTRYLEHFPRDQIRIYLHEDFESGPMELMSDLYRFIGVEPSFRPDVSTHHNAAPTREVPEWDPVSRDRVLDLFEPDIQIVEQVIDRDLAAWRRPTSLPTPDAENTSGG